MTRCLLILAAIVAIPFIIAAAFAAAQGERR